MPAATAIATASHALRVPDTRMAMMMITAPTTGRSRGRRSASQTNTRRPGMRIEVNCALS
jgi:hypothetical protein